MELRLKRAYEAPAPEDGERYLVERLWPRGLRREAAALAGWLRELAPSTGLRQWYAHEPSRWHGFRERYCAELERPEAQERLRWLAGRLREGPVTLVFAARDAEHSSAAVLRSLIGERWLPPSVRDSPPTP